MNNVFNKAQMLETSEKCNKFSKSVSYETLVGGTATIGCEYKQIRRLSKCSADKPLSAVGTLTSLLCNSAKVKEKLLHRHPERSEGSIKTETVMPDLIGHLSRIKKEAAEFLGSRLLSCPRMTMLWILRLRLRMTMKRSLRMTIPALAFLLSLNLSTAFAEITCTKDGTKLIISGIETFSGCPGNSHKTATEVTIGTDVTSIGSEAFRYASSLTSITIPNSVTSIGDSAFNGATSLTSITIPDSVKSIGDSAFASTGLTSITIPDSVTSIGNYAFWGASSLESITIPDSVTSIGSEAFRGASSLTSITIPEGVTSIGNYIFAGASSLGSIIIPDNIDTARWNANVFQYLPKNTDIVCQGDVNTCYEKLAKYFTKETCPQNLKDVCNCTSNCIKKEIQPAQSSEQCNGSYIYENGNCHKRNEEQCNASGKYYYNGATCLYRPRNGQIVCVNPNYKANDGYCDRLRYTPAEAAKVLRDDNTNEITITFKK